VIKKDVLVQEIPQIATEPSSLKAALGIVLLLAICAWCIYRKARWQREADEVWRAQMLRIKEAEEIRRRDEIHL
jgi:hypothetical protein